MPEKYRSSFSNEIIFQKVVDQLNKDFGEDVVRWPLTPENLDSLFLEVCGIVDSLLEKSIERLLQWCYRIDLPQEKIAQALNPSGNQEPVKEISAMILLREAQKVELREKWSKKLDIDSRTT
ncbi:MAG: hypothetical protein ACPGED_08420 [Flavobacteriales bacterium]